MLQTTLPTDSADSTETDTTPASNMADTTDTSDPQFRSNSHELNENWEWSDEFTKFVASHIEPPSLVIAPGLRPIGDVNLDLKDLREVAQTEGASFSVAPLDAPQTVLPDSLSLCESVKNQIYGRIIPTTASSKRHTQSLYSGGIACHGDMFDLPFNDNTFRTVIADPPWLELSATERQAVFKEAALAVSPGGKILYNATWIPEDEHTRQYDLRARQQRDFWGGSSFIAFYRRTAQSYAELFDACDYEPSDRYPSDSRWWSETYHPNAVDPTYNTDPRLVSTDCLEFCCPMCSHAELGQLRTDEFFEQPDGTYSLYQCTNCGFRVNKAAIIKLATALQTASEARDIPIHSLSEIDYTPTCVDKLLEQYQTGARTQELPFSPDFPWVPTEKYNAYTG